MCENNKGDTIETVSRSFENGVLSASAGHQVSGGIILEVIVTNNLTKKYGSLLALSGLNLKISRGRCVGLLGPNGAGKSTTIKLICGLIRPTSGRVLVNGFEPSKDPKSALVDVGSLVDVPVFYPNHTPLQILNYFGRLRGMENPELRKRVKECIDMVKLTEFSKTKVKKFSLGMVQRLALAQAVLHDPSVLILDEPALGLDPRGIRQVRDFIKRQAREGKTVLFSSHMLYETQEICDTVALINRGKLLAYDRIENLEKIFNIQVVEVETVSPLSSQQIDKIRNIKWVKSVSNEGNGGHLLRINFNGDREKCAELHAELVREIGAQVVSFRPSVGALEEVYLQLVKE
ncbi:MAG: ABC transporter ATP-binding protein [Candidatus Hadarchaeales archaeon]